jgi:hypothetical protein
VLLPLLSVSLWDRIEPAEAQVRSAAAGGNLLLPDCHHGAWLTSTMLTDCDHADCRR